MADRLRRTVKRMKFIVVPILAVLVLAGCAGPTDDAATSPAAPASTPASASTQTVTPSATPAPTAAPSSATPTEGPADASSATCDNLLDPATIEKFEASGAALSDNKKEDTYPFGDFAKYGGVVCVWGAKLNVTTAFAYGPITDEQAAKQQKKLDKTASKTGPNENGGTYYEVPGGEAGEADSQIFVFSPKGYWAWSFDNGGGAVIEEVVANAPVFY